MRPKGPEHSILRCLCPLKCVQGSGHDAALSLGQMKAAASRRIPKFLRRVICSGAPSGRS